MKYVFCLFVLLSSLSLHAQSWQKTYGINDSFMAGSIVETYDKGFLIAGTIGDSSFFSSLMKIDINGNILWQKYSDSLLIVDNMLPFKNGSMILGGHRGHDTGYSIIIKLNPCMDTLWGTILLDSSTYFGTISGLYRCKNGDILAICSNYYKKKQNQPSVLYCLDSNGNFKWNYAEKSYIDHLLLNADGSILVCASVYTPDANLPMGTEAIHSIVTLLDSDGAMLWSDVYGNTTPYKYGDLGIGFHAPDGGFISIHCNADYNHINEGNFYMVKYDTKGNKEWIRYFGDTTSYEWFNNGVAVNDSTYILIGATQDTSYSYMAFRLTKVNSSGKILARKDYFKNLTGNGYTIQKTSDKKYIICGGVLSSPWNGINYTGVLKIDENLELDTFYSHSNYSYDNLCSYKIDSTDTIHFPHNYTIARVDTMQFYTGIETVSSQSPLQLKIYPNPFTNSTNISYTLQQTENAKIEVMDIMGRNIAMLVNSKQEPGNHSSIFNAGDYNFANAGIYIVRMTVGSSVTNKQIILVK